jgi:hypothetical protein
MAAIAQAAVAVLLLNPFAIVPGRTVTTGAWSDPARIASVRDMPGVLLVEDSGLLVAGGREPIVDDIFLWSRVYAHSKETGSQFLEGDRLLGAVRAREFDAIVSEVVLEALDGVGGFERQRWHPDLVAAILEGYSLKALPGPIDSGPPFVYTRR